MITRNINNVYKLCAVALIGAVCLAVLAGCGAKPDTQASQSVSGTAILQETAATLAPSAGVAPTSSPRAFASPSTSASPSATAVLKPTAKPSTPSAKPLEGVVIGLDPGHQAKQNSNLEPVAPGSSNMKPKVSSGTQGIVSKVEEHVVNLAVALKLRDMLEKAGATVVMTRTKADVDISNKQRAQLFNDKKVDLGVRIHSNGIDDSSVHGAFMLIPKSNPFEDDCRKAAQLIIDSYTRETGIKKLSTEVRSDQTGFNWCERPIVNIEMGHMSNPTEDLKITDKDFQTTMAQGIYNGIVEYFKEKAAK